jgi:hypothetical protein
LDEEIEDLALVVNGPPQPQPLAADGDYHFIQMPVIAGLRSLASKVGGDHRPELDEPPADRFVGHIQAPFGEHLLDVAQTECEACIKPNRLTDDRRREAVSLEAERGHSPPYSSKAAPLT